MGAYGAFFRRFHRFCHKAAVGAHPEFFLIPLEQFLVFDVGQQQAVLFFMALFNFRYPFEQEGDLFKTFFFCLFC